MSVVDHSALLPSFIERIMDPSVFQCNQCKTILADSYGFVSLESGLDGILLSGQ